ncbi:MAG: sugar phosphate isomerase/epimerase [Rhodothermales bacterium]|nr:sugar phosphate isomerase/epimerase [Rhodothermales bacterium]
MLPASPETPRRLDLGIVTDEIARDLEHALERGAAWGLRRFELRETNTGRFPFLAPGEVRLLEDALTRGARITAVSPGILKGPVEDERKLNHELQEVLPKTLDLAQHVKSPVLIVFGFERQQGEPDRNRLYVLRAFERVAEAAAEAGLIVATENEPGFWIDDPDGSVSLLEELDHPAFRLNWDPGNLHLGGMLPGREAFETVRPYLANLHVKDFDPDDEAAPWKPVGRGQTPWPALIEWVARETDLEHATLETRCAPLEANSRASLDALRLLLDGLGDSTEHPAR